MYHPSPHVFHFTFPVLRTFSPVVCHGPAGAQEGAIAAEVELLLRPQVLFPGIRLHPVPGHLIDAWRGLRLASVLVLAAYAVTMFRFRWFLAHLKRYPDRGMT